MTCVLCLPHYLTLMFCMLPLFSPASAASNLSRLALSEEEYRGSSLELVIGLVGKVLGELEDDLHRDCNGLSVEDDESARRHKSSQLFLNEIDQLQTQMRHLLNVGSRRNCCDNGS